MYNEGHKLQMYNILLSTKYFSFDGHMAILCMVYYPHIPIIRFLIKDLLNKKSFHKSHLITDLPWKILFYFLIELYFFLKRI